MNNKQHWPFFILILAGVVLRIYFINQVDFYPDTVTHLNVADFHLDEVGHRGSMLKGGIDLTQERTPGGLYIHSLWFLKKYLGFKFIHFHYLYVLSQIAIILLFYLSLGDYFSKFATLGATSYVSLGLTFLEIFQKPINGNFVVFFTFLIFYLLTQLFIKKKLFIYPILFFSICVAAQFHFVHSVYFLIVLALMFIFKLFPRVREMVFSLILITIAYGPYVFQEKENSISFTRPILHRLLENVFNDITEKASYLSDVFFNFISFIPFSEIATQSTILHRRTALCSLSTCHNPSTFIMSLLTLGGFLFVLFGMAKLWKSHSGFDRLIKYVLCMGIPLSWAILSTTTTFAGHWRYFYILPFLLCLIGKGLDHFSFKKISIIVVCLNLLAITSFWHMNKRKIHFRYDLFRLVSEKIHTDYGYDRDDIFSDKIQFIVNYDLINHLKDQWALQHRETIWYIQWSRFYMEIPYPKAKPKDNICLLIFVKDNHFTKLQSLDEDKIKGILRQIIIKKEDMKYFEDIKIKNDKVTFVEYSKEKCGVDFIESKPDVKWFKK